MAKFFTYLSIVLLSVSCAPISYIGAAFKPTEKIDVFVDEGAIKRNYSIIGKGYVRGSIALTSPEKVQSNAIEKAREKGADAILVKDYYLPLGYNGVNTTLRTDSIGQGTVTIGSSAISSTNAEFIVLFLKYQ